MDPIYPNIDSTQFPISVWSKFQGKVEEPILPNAPKALGNAMDLCIFIDIDHAGD